MRTVFIIEGDPVALRVYQAQFEEAGYNVRTPADGEESVYLLLHNSSPDAILLDLMLPRLNGVDVLKTIRAQCKFETIPIFAFTNNDLGDLAKKAMDAGANQVFDKTKTVPGDIVDAVRESLAVSFQTIPTFPGEEFTRTNIDKARETIAGLCKTLQALSKVEDQQKRLDHLSHLHKMIGELAGQATTIGLDSVSQMSTALDGLLKQLSEDPNELSASSLRTISYAIDFLDVLFKPSSAPDPAVAGPIRVLVIDDDDICRMAILSALERANLDSESVETPQAALEILATRSFDLIFLDISMPEMSGFEVCQKLRKLPAHRTTPVIFVTSLSDFASRSQGKLIGGSDFIAKPFLFAELTVKALTHSFKHRLLVTSASIDRGDHASLEEARSPENGQSACLGSPLSDLSVSFFPTKDSNLCPAEENTSSRSSPVSRAAPITDAVGFSSGCTNPHDESLENLNFQESVSPPSESFRRAAINGAITFDENGIIKALNSVAAILFGYESMQITGQSISLLIPEVAQGNTAKFKKFLAISFETTKGVNLVGQRLNGSRFAFNLVLKEIAVSGCQMFTGVIRARGAADEVSQTSVNSRVANHLPCGPSSKTREIPESEQPIAIDASDIKGKSIIECEMASSTNSRAMLDRQADAGQELDLRCDELSRICDGLEKDRDKHQKWAEALQEAVNRLETVLTEKAFELEDVRSMCQRERAQGKILKAQLAELSLSHSSLREELNNRQQAPNDLRATPESQRSSNEGTR